MSDALPYAIESFETVAETEALRVVVLTLAPGELVPWHYHSEVTDHFFCLEGPMVIEAPGDEPDVVLQVGERHSVPPRRHHQVRGQGGGRCRFAIVQGLGRYDFVPISTD